MRIFHLSDLHIGLKLINRDLREDRGIYTGSNNSEGRRESA